MRIRLEATSVGITDALHYYHLHTICRDSLVSSKGRNPEKRVQLRYVNLSNTNTLADSR